MNGLRKLLKTYKIFIGGQFPRTESGRFFPLKNKNGETFPKNLRNAEYVNKTCNNKTIATVKK